MYMCLKKEREDAMGLDNGIMMRPTANQSKICALLASDQDGWYEVAYWRRCYNIRGAILDIIDGLEGKDGNATETTLAPQAVRAIAEMLESYCADKRKWEEDYEKGETIWSWDDVERQLNTQVKKLNLLAQLMEGGEIEEVIFYDSY